MSGADWFVCDVANCEQGFPTMAEVVAHERTHRARAEERRTVKGRVTVRNQPLAMADTPDAMSEMYEALTRIKALVDEQAEDEGLWFQAQTVPEAYLQQALRRLHGLIEMEVDGA